MMLVVLLPVVILTSAGTWARFSLRRANRVGPGRSASTAPIPWLWSPGVAATLHRRLRSACQLAGSVVSSHPEPPRRRWTKKDAPPPSDTIVDLAREVVEEAVQLDHQLVKTSWLGARDREGPGARGHRLPGERHRGHGAACAPARYEAGAGRQPAGAGGAHSRRQDFCNGSRLRRANSPAAGGGSGRPRSCHGARWLGGGSPPNSSGLSRRRGEG